ncbi:hypothetical protein PRO82_000760 [Candidatus Protochlamydia amoebophila]|uniref:hypothetical protein n=1 Tax=Candidatus Protochlamydia amoebophila TaxID=362787 RepID=UPI001BC94695|nr:hypothetical protein [Candidatus Protochlamydia amoebophila]MBS4163458.1 hypothetical protein [Candidatus Protochlamydia amoebophila]
MRLEHFAILAEWKADRQFPSFQKGKNFYKSHPPTRKAKYRDNGTVKARERYR